jgi:hypothetical protein
MPLLQSGGFLLLGNVIKSMPYRSQSTSKLIKPKFVISDIFSNDRH